jgi:hypothetical protein
MTVGGRRSAVSRSRLRSIRGAYRWAQGTRIAPLLRGGPVERIRRTLLAWPANVVVDTVRALEGAGVATWVGGGWGVDALLGRRTRRHADLDLFYVRDAQPLCEALTAAGFEVRHERYIRGRLIRTAIARSPDGRIVDVMTTLDPAALGRDALAVGVVNGKRIPCLSAPTQLALHTGYAPERADRHDMKLLGRAFGFTLPPEYVVRAPARESALIVPVAGADPVVARHRARFDPVARRGMPAHVTALYPFAPVPCLDAAMEQAIQSVLAGRPGFPYRLARLGRFPGVLYLAPEPANAFIELTEALSKRWPEYPPYRGAHDGIVPHLTVAHGPTPPGVETELERALPIEAAAEEVWLMTEGRRGWWSLRRRFPLGRPPDMTRDEHPNPST